MNSSDRRTWLKTAGFSGGLALLGGWNTNSTPGTHFGASIATNEIAKPNFNENPYGPLDTVRSAITKAFNPDHALEDLKYWIIPSQNCGFSGIVISHEA